MENSPTFDDVTYLIVIVPVLGAELREHLLKTRCFRSDIDDVSGDIATHFLEPFDLGFVCGKYLFSRSVSGDIKVPSMTGTKSSP